MILQRQKVLDQLCPDRPLLIWHRSFHEIYLNRQMLFLFLLLSFCKKILSDIPLSIRSTWTGKCQLQPEWLIWEFVSNQNLSHLLISFKSEQLIWQYKFLSNPLSAALDNLDFEDEDAVRAHHQVDVTISQL